MKRLAFFGALLFLLVGVGPCCRYVFSPFYEEATIKYDLSSCEAGYPYVVTYTNKGSRVSDDRWVKIDIRSPGHSTNLNTIYHYVHNDFILSPGASAAACYKFDEVDKVVPATDRPALKLSVQVLAINPQ